MMREFETDLAEKGQGSAEFALVTAALLGVVLGLSALGHLFSDGVLMQHAVDAASHHVEGAMSAVADVFVY